MVESHYLISAYIKKGSDLKFKDDRKGNPFCQFEVTGLRKLTEMRLRTSNPVWNERLDIVTDTKPKSALLVCKDFVDTKNHLEVGRAVIALDTLLHDGVDELTIPINRLDVAGTIEGKGEIGLNLNFKRIPSNRHHHFSWTHLLHFDIENIEDLPLYARCIEKGSELVLRVKFGIQQFATQFFDNTESGLDSSGFLFVDDESMRRDDLEFKLVIRRDETEHLIGQGRLAVEALFSDFEEQLKNKVVLTEKSESNLTKAIGTVKLRTVLSPRSKIEKRMVEDIFDEYDYDFDRRLSKEELFDMLSTLLPDKDLEWILKKVEVLALKNKSFVYKDDLLFFLKSPELQETPFMNLLVIASLKGRAFPSTSHLLRGVSYPSAQSSSFVAVKNRYSNKIIEEKVPTYVTLAMKSMRQINDPKLQKLSSDLMPRLTHRQGWHFDSKQSRFEIIPFMAMHKIGLDSLSKPISSFKNFNDFFSRSLSAETRPLHSDGKETVAVAPADCRMTVYKSIRDCDKILVKGTGINLQNLLCNVDMAADFSDGSVAVCRLAPCDAHSWNAPVKGVQGRIFSIEGEMNAVHPVARNHDALHRNKRVVTEIVSNDFGKVGFVAVGGPLVNSVQVEAKPLQEIARGQRHGCFKFGGSTVVLLFAKQRIGFDSDLLKNSLEPIETFVKANDRIGIAMQPQRESAKKKN